jgi:hypothetical protein
MQHSRVERLVDAYWNYRALRGVGSKARHSDSESEESSVNGECDSDGTLEVDTFFGAEEDPPEESLSLDPRVMEAYREAARQHVSSLKKCLNILSPLSDTLRPEVEALPVLNELWRMPVSKETLATTRAPPVLGQYKHHSCLGVRLLAGQVVQGWRVIFRGGTFNTAQQTANEPGEPAV